MSPPSPCPGGQEVRRLLLGLLSGPDADALERHLLSCDRCGTRLPDVPAEDAVLEAMRRAAPPPLEPDDRSAVAVLTARLKRLAAERTPGPEEGDDRRAAADVLGRLAGYRVGAVLGAGGMGVVFRAEDVALRRPVALKVMKPSLAAGAAARARFLREARVMAAVKHDHVVTIHAVGEADGVPYLAMELLEGETLEQRLRRGPAALPSAEVVRVGREAAEGLAAAHAAGLVHRDVKPGNIWLETLPGERGVSTPRYRVKLLDFGLARAAEPDVALTQSGAIVGTPAYMAPEQGRGEKVDARADLFSLGCVLYQLATGRPPFAGSTLSALLLAVATHRPPPAHAVNPDVPPALSALIARMMAKEPSARPPSARAVADALADLPLAPATPPRRARRLMLAVAGGLLAVLGIAALLAFRGDRPPHTTRPAGAPLLNPDHADHPLDRLRADLIPESARFDGQPDELVGVLGEAGTVCQCVTFAPDGRRVLTARRFRDPRNVEATLLQVWDVATGKAVRRFEERGWVTSLTFAPDGRHFVQTGDAPPLLRDADTGEAVRTLRGTGDFVFCSAFAPDGRTLLTGDRAGHARPGSLCWWDARSGELKRRLRGHTYYAALTAFCPDGRHAVSASHGPDCTLRLWDLESGRQLRRWTFDKRGSGCLAVSSDGRLVAVGQAEGSVLVWDLDDTRDQPWRELRGHSERVHSLYFSSGETLTSLAADYRILRHDLKTGAVVFRRKLPGAAGAAAVAPDGRHLAVANGDGTLFLFRLP